MILTEAFETASMTDGSRGWILWVALAVMTADSLVSLLPMIRQLVVLLVGDLGSRYRLARQLGVVSVPSSQLLEGDVSDYDDDEEEVEKPERLVPLKVVIWGVFGSITLGTIIVRAVFGYEGIKTWATIIGFLVGSFLSLLG